MQHTHDILQSIIFFRGLDDADRQVIVHAATEQHTASGSYLFHEGTPATAFYVIVQGNVRLTQLTEDGKQVILGMVGAGDGLGIIAALPNADYPLSAQAVEPLYTLVWHSDTLMQFMERYPLIAYHTLRMIAGRFGELQKRYRELATERVERRIARTLLRLARQVGRKETDGVLIDMPLSRQDIAEMSGTTLFTVSRTLRQWEQQTIVASGRERVVICKPHALVTIADDLPIPSNNATPDADDSSLAPPCLR